MAKFLIIAASTLQIVGADDGQAEAGDVLGTIETNCEIGSLVSCLNFGGAKVEAVKKSKKAAATVEDDVDEDIDSPASDEAAVAAGTETPAATRSRRQRRT